MAEVRANRDIARVDGAGLRARREEFESLLEDAVADGASVGFVLPNPRSDIENYWRGVALDLDAGNRILLACAREGRIVGSVQLAFCEKPNGRHRAEIQKLLVLRRERRQGTGIALMSAAERLAQEHGRWLLLLDTREGAASDLLYRRLGWTAFGRVDAYACDPDGTLAACTFFTKRLDGVSA